MVLQEINDLFKGKQLDVITLGKPFKVSFLWHVLKHFPKKKEKKIAHSSPMHFSKKSYLKKIKASGKMIIWYNKHIIYQILEI